MREHDRYQRLKSIYLEARLLVGESRGRFLEGQCQGDPELHREVLELLDQDSELMTVIEATGAEPVAPGIAAAPIVATGTRVGPFEIEEPIGHGGMGIVFRARDVRLERRVALKFLAVGEGSRPPSEDAVGRFLAEARAASALDHPNVCTVHDFGVWEGHAYLAMAYYPGESLQERLVRGPLPIAEAVEVGAQVASGLAAAHAAEIVHRDIKPSNVLLSDRGLVKILDFGLATHPGRERLTRTGLTVGTPGFMAPEQIKGQAVTAASDVWALGVLLYEMLTGRPPFRGESLPATVYSTVHEEPPDLRAARPEVPEWLLALVVRCLRKEPGKRYADAGEVLEALERGPNESPIDAGRESSSGRRLMVAAVVTALAAVSLVALILVPWWRQESHRRWLHAQALPEIRELAQDDLVAAFRSARDARQRVSDDPQLEQIWLDLTLPTSLESVPSGAEVAVQGYREHGSDWIVLGRTPMEGIRLPRAALRYRLSLEGYQPLEVASSILPLGEPFRLFTEEDAPEGMVPVPGGRAHYFGVSAEVPPFWIGRYEVTQREYLRFVEAGGYRRPELWQHPFVEGDRVLSWEEAMDRFVDATGMAGPATWSLGTYPEGKGDHPVEGVSWHEASAYAEFVGRSLPSVFHWRRALGHGIGYPDLADMVLASNLGGRGTVAVGSSGGLGAYGIHDLAGNVKEWCANPAGEMRYILGASWRDPPYKFRNPDAQPPMERREGFGFRLVHQSEPIAPELLREVSPARVEEIPEPVDDLTFGLYASLFDYDRAPLEARIEEVDDSHQAWRREVVTLEAAYPGERVTAHLFLPKRGRPPYQTVVHFPGDESMILSTIREASLFHIEPFLRSGRAVVYPVYKGTFERRGDRGRLGPLGVRDLRAQMIQDLRRTLDYVETRPDIDPERIAFHAVGHGSVLAPFALALEQRFRAAMILSGGIIRHGQPPEIQPQNFLPRATVPVLLITGRHDFVFPYESSQVPFFELLGTPLARKRHVVLEVGHLPPRSAEVVRELLAWADLWLGPVEG